MGRAAAEDPPGQTIVVGGTVQQMLDVRCLHTIGLVGVSFVQPGCIDLVVVPVARVDRNRCCPVACGLHPESHAVPLRERVAFLEIRKAQHPRPARESAQHRVGLLDIADEIRERHLGRSQAAVPGRMVADRVARARPVPDEVQSLRPAGAHKCGKHHGRHACIAERLQDLPVPRRGRGLLQGIEPVVECQRHGLGLDAVRSEKDEKRGKRAAQCSHRDARLNGRWLAEAEAARRAHAGPHWA